MSTSKEVLKAMADGYNEGFTETQVMVAMGLLVPREDITTITTERDRLAAENEALREALKPFATFRDCEPHFPGDPAPTDLLSDRGPNGTLCMPDCHGYALVWADEHDGGVVNITAGQLRRARAVYEAGGSA